MVFHWIFSDSKTPQVSRTLLSILAYLNNVAVWMVSTRPLFSKPPSPFINPLVTVPRAPIIIGKNVTLHVLQFFQFPSKVKVFILLFSFFQFFLLRSARIKKIHNSANSLFLLIITRPGRLAEIRWSACISEFQRILCVSFSWTNSSLCIKKIYFCFFSRGNTAKNIWMHLKFHRSRPIWHITDKR